MSSPSRFLVVAGDPSGDLLAANLVMTMKKLKPGIHVSALGGKHLRASSDKFLEDLVSQYAQGFAISLKKILFFKKVLENVITKELKEGKIDRVVLVDFYGFNKHVATLAAKHGTPVDYYVCPQFWASRPKRLDRVKSFIQRFLVLFPFETNFYKDRGLSATYVGHPLLDSILAVPSNHNGPRRVEPLIGLLPGSRPDEIKRHLPLMLDVCERIVEEWPGARFVLFAAPDLQSDIYSNFLKSKSNGKNRLLIEIVKDENYQWRSQLDLAITASGLEVLESALLGIPVVVMYKMHWVTYLIARSIITVPYIAMPNLLAGRRIVPEFIQHKAQAEPIAQMIKSWLKNPTELDRIRQELLSLREGFGAPGASERAAKVILETAA